MQERIFAKQDELTKQGGNESLCLNDAHKNFWQKLYVEFACKEMEECAQPAAQA